jgi:flagellar basal-body rod protein FlgB
MSDSIQCLEKTLDGAALRQKVLAHNLANLNTPGFTRLEVDFRQALGDAMRAGGREAVAGVQPVVREDTSGPARPDGNNVSMQKELGSMAENGLLYDFATKALSSKYRQLVKAIGG